MTITYVVKAGDWLAKIAREHGTTVPAIWHHPENAGHRDRRGSPDTLYPGDVLRIEVGGVKLPVPTGGAGASSSPGGPVPGVTTPTPVAWPYPAFKGVWQTGPTWECPGGTCACHPVTETEVGAPHTIVLYDPRGVRMPGARCRVEEQGRVITEAGLTADALGEVRVNVRASTSTLRVEWAPPDLPGGPWIPYRKLYNLKLDDGDKGLDLRLANLGFSRGKRREDNVADYQRAYSREPTGNPEEIRLEVLQRHDHGMVEPFHPQGEVAEVERMRPVSASLFASPTPRASSTARLAPQEEGSAAGGSVQSSRGASVPEVSDLVLAVVPPPHVTADPTRTKVWLRAVAVRDLGPDERDREIEPTRAANVPTVGLVCNFNGLPLGIYDAIVVMETAPAAAPRKVATGWRRVTVRNGSITVSSLAAELERPVHSIDDPLLDVDIPGMQRRRKLLATLYTHFPMCLDKSAAAKGWKPPYDQGEFKHQLMGTPRENTCATVAQSMVLNGLGTTLPTVGASTQDPLALQKLKARDYFVNFAEGLAPSVGDIIYYDDGQGVFQHTGIIVDASPEIDVNWISADGGQPANTSEFVKKKGAGWGRFWAPPPTAESSWFLPRRVFRAETGEICVAHGWAQPVWSPENTQGYGGYRIVGWVDLAHPSLTQRETAYTKRYTEAAYHACRDLVRKVRLGALADQVACRAIATYEDAQ